MTVAPGQAPAAARGGGADDPRGPRACGGTRRNAGTCWTSSWASGGPRLAARGPRARGRPHRRRRRRRPGRGRAGRAVRHGRGAVADAVRAAAHPLAGARSAGRAGLLEATERLPVLYGAPSLARPPARELDAPAVRCRSTCSAVPSPCSPATRRRARASGIATTASRRGCARRTRGLPRDPDRRRLRRAAVGGAAADVAAAAARPRDYRGAAHPRRRRPAVDASGGAGRCSPASSSATSSRRRDPRLLLRRARALVDARRGDLRPGSAQHLRLPDDGQRAARPAQRVLLPRRTTTSNPRGGRYDLVDHPWVGRLMGRVHAAATRSASTPASAPTATRSGRRRSSPASARSPSGEGVRQDRWGGRQHYLQWANPTTWRNWDEAGLDYDCTLGVQRGGGLPHRDLPRVSRFRPRCPPAARAA